MNYKLPKLDISESGQIWMKAIYSKMKKGEKVEYRHLRAELAGTLPFGFMPDEIDNRLLQGRVNLTLLGVWNIDTESDFVPKTESVIRCIANLLTINPEITRLDAKLVVEELHISIQEVRVIFLLITLFGFSYYWSGGQSSIDGYGFDEIWIEGYHIFDQYVSYQGIEKEIWDFYNRESKPNPMSPTAFIAMWFSDYMMEVFSDCISKAIEEAGYVPFIISLKEHNEDICDNIIAEIRKSKFLIADFTGQRGGVYFEAGFAYGLGLPAIWTCQEDWFKKTVDKEVDGIYRGNSAKVIIKEERYTHFDIEHFNFIVWKDGSDLYNKLKTRIAATII
ncbi:MAG: hypothetical protein ACYCVD_19750 [Desulfitobacteriaceae bacterium]